jgi:hypothetical protein
MRGSAVHLRTLIGCLLLASTAAGAQDSTAERTRIAAERRQIEVRYASEESECRQRFFVTACLEAAKARRREALDVLRSQELALDDAERLRRADERLRAVEARRAEVAARAPAASQPEPVAPVAPMAASSVPSAPAASGTSASISRTRDAAASEAAARRAAAAERRRAEAAAAQARIAEREAARASGGQRSAPLPLRPEDARP